MTKQAARPGSSMVLRSGLDREGASGLGNSRSAPLLMIGLDAAEITLVERWMNDGLLPNLHTLRERGAFGPLKSTAEWLVGSPWPSFYTGTPPEEHGMYYYHVWRPENMTTERPSSEWMPLRPFWRSLGGAGRRAVVVDVPIVYAPEPFDGVEISGWSTRDTLGSSASFPPQLMKWVHATFGAPPFDPKETYLLSAAELLRVRDQCNKTTEHVRDLGVALMQKEPWDLFLICFASPHRGGHLLWDLTGMAGNAKSSDLKALKDALKEIYIACDAAVGRLVEQAAPNVTTLVFSVHGMGANASCCDLLPEMLSRILNSGQSAGQPPGKLHQVSRLRASVPIRWRSWVKNRLPVSAQDKLTAFWRTGGFDWSSTKAFAPFGDLEGYVRINLRGREAEGIVDPGTEYQDLSSHIVDGLWSFVDEDSGEPIVDSVERRDQVFFEASMRDRLPDLIIHWAPRAAAEHRRIVSPRYGVLPWPTPGRHPQGRSGNHRPAGFLIASGDRVAPRTVIENAHILDLAPTVLSLLDLPAPEHMKGRSLW